MIANISARELLDATLPFLNDSRLENRSMDICLTSMDTTLNENLDEQFLERKKQIFL
jgi:hypothetical protein